MAHQTHYEVLVKQNGRWEIHGRHSSSEKDQAIEEAKALDGQKHIQGVKVIQEIFDPDEGTSKEYNVYAPGQKKYQPPRKQTKKKSEEETEEDATSPSSKNRKNIKNKKKKSTKSFVSIVLSIAMISGFSTVVGVCATTLGTCDSPGCSSNHSPSGAPAGGDMTNGSLVLPLGLPVLEVLAE